MYIFFDVFFSSPGKTWSVALFVLSLLINVPGIRVCVFSTGKRASGGLMQIIVDFLARIKGGTDRIMRRNQEELFIGPPCGEEGKGKGRFKTANEGNTSKLFSFPSSVSGKIKNKHIHTHAHTHTHTRTYLHMHTVFSFILQ